MKVTRRALLCVLLGLALRASAITNFAGGSNPAPVTAPVVSSSIRAPFTIYGPAHYTTGGTGLATVLVSNTNDSGAGSLRTALACSGGCRISCAGLSGTITLQSQIVVSQPNITLDCSDAAGIVQVTGEATAGGALIDIAADNVILRYLKVRGAAVTCDTGNDKQCDIDMINVASGSDQVVLDHVSLVGAVDGLLDMPGDHANVTIQNSLLCRPAYTRDPVYPDGSPPQSDVGLFGGSAATLSGVALYRNLLCEFGDRGPDIQSGTAGASDVLAVQNVYYDSVYHVNLRQRNAAGTLYFDAVGNVIKAGPSGRSSPYAGVLDKLPFLIGAGTGGASNIGTIVVAGTGNALVDNSVSRTWRGSINGSVSSPALETDVWAFEGSEAGGTVPSNTAGYVPTFTAACPGGTRCYRYAGASTHTYASYPAESLTSAQVLSTVLATVGASLPSRDSLDAEIVSDVTNGTRSVAFPAGNPVLP